MSRIHDALNKAAQEKGTERGLEDSLVAAERGADRQDHGSASDWENPLESAVGKGQESPARLTHEALLTYCQHVHWSPDSKTILSFANGQAHEYGSEELRTLRSRLYQIRGQKPLQSVLITSALPGEGKSFIAANLAMAIVRQPERRALLIDADLRMPVLHRSLGTPLTPGLSDHLRGDADEFSIVQKSPRHNLFFISAGKPSSNPAELLGNGRLKNLLHRLAPAFDWILVDSPPVVPLSDACLLSELCDGVLMVVRASSTPFDLAQKACQKFDGKPLLGVVLNRVKRGASYSAYYYNHYPPAAKIGSDKS
jgi:protein-tyrosine kinase